MLELAMLELVEGAELFTEELDDGTELFTEELLTTDDELEGAELLEDELLEATLDEPVPPLLPIA